MSKYTGTITRNDLEGGFWQLEAEDGARYQLQGGGDDLHVEGQRVEIDGKVESSTMGIGMAGPVLSVSSWKNLA
jgi:hypothetical protein